MLLMPECLDCHPGSVKRPSPQPLFNSSRGSGSSSHPRELPGPAADSSKRPSKRPPVNSSRGSRGRSSSGSPQGLPVPAAGSSKRRRGNDSSADAVVASSSAVDEADGTAASSLAAAEADAVRDWLQNLNLEMYFDAFAEVGTCNGTFKSMCV